MLIKYLKTALGYENRPLEGALEDPLGQGVMRLHLAPLASFKSPTGA